MHDSTGQTWTGIFPWAVSKMIQMDLRTAIPSTTSLLSTYPLPLLFHSAAYLCGIWVCFLWVQQQKQSLAHCSVYHSVELVLDFEALLSCYCLRILNLLNAFQTVKKDCSCLEELPILRVQSLLQKCFPVLPASGQIGSAVGGGCCSLWSSLRKQLCFDLTQGMKCVHIWEQVTFKLTWTAKVLNKACLVKSRKITCSKYRGCYFWHIFIRKFTKSEFPIPTGEAACHWAGPRTCKRQSEKQKGERKAKQMRKAILTLQARVFWWYVGYSVLGITQKRFSADQQAYCRHFQWTLAPGTPEVFLQIWSGSPRKRGNAAAWFKYLLTAKWGQTGKL